MNESRERRSPPKITVALCTVAFFSILLGFIMLAYWGFRYAKLIEPMTVLLSGLVGSVLFCAFAATLSSILGHRMKDNLTDALRDTVFYAIDQISKGNFDVFIDSNSNTPFSDLSDAINKMAQNLGSLETMRQDFISNVSHEIQSPLTSIKGFAALLQNDDLPPIERKRYAAIIEAESRRLSVMSDNLMKLSALDTGNNPLNVEDYRLDKQLRSAVLALEPQWSEKSINIDIKADKLTVTADSALLAQVWTNVLSNAIKFTPEDGTIEISATEDGVIITDSGTGIAEEDLIHVFERFYKADKSRDRSLCGNGLGLAIVKKIVELHSGSVAITSSPGKGTSVKIGVPGLRSV
ncbi:MAG: sensor histidine kinase [Clostridiales bacterium]|nr:sensor histidine kinase [Clostridiales bacterium]